MHLLTVRGAIVFAGINWDVLSRGLAPAPFIPNARRANCAINEANISQLLSTEDALEASPQIPEAAQAAFIDYDYRTRVNDGTSGRHERMPMPLELTVSPVASSLGPDSMRQSTVQLSGGISDTCSLGSASMSNYASSHSGSPRAKGAWPSRRTLGSSCTPASAPLSEGNRVSLLVPSVLPFESHSGRTLRDKSANISGQSGLGGGGSDGLTSPQSIEGVTIARPPSGVQPPFILSVSSNSEKKVGSGGDDTVWNRVAVSPVSSSTRQPHLTSEME